MAEFVIAAATLALAPAGALFVAARALWRRYAKPRHWEP